MARLTPEEGAAKWAQRTAAATADVARGIDRVTQAPGAKAAAASGKWLSKVTAAEDKFKRGSQRVTLDEWKTAAKEGTNRISAGVNAKKHKMADFATAFYAHLDRGKQAIDQMPTDTLEGGIQKAVAQMRHNANFKR